MRGRAEHRILTIADGGGNKPAKVIADLWALPNNVVLRRSEPLIDNAAGPRPYRVIGRHIETIQARSVRVWVAIAGELTRERLGITVVAPLQKVADA